MQRGFCWHVLAAAAALYLLVPLCAKCQVADRENQKLWKKETMALTLPPWSSQAQLQQYTYFGALPSVTSSAYELKMWP